MSANLGRLVKVELREAWISESTDFTPWLALPENIRLLGEAIGMELEVEAQEKEVGPFRADILCKDTATGAWVLIENQLERTDHTHLGQLVTYAAGLDAVTIVWLAQRFTEEHRAALDWLNKVTDERINFFGLEIELWRIGDSLKAPKFNVVSMPNEWTRSVTDGVNQLPLTEAKTLQLEFWTQFKKSLQDKGSILRATKPHPQHWMNLSIGRGGFQLTAILSTWDSDSGSYDKGEIRAELLIWAENASGYFDQLKVNQLQIEKELGEPLTWHSPDDKNQRRVFLRRTADIRNRDLWPELNAWLQTKLEALHRVFGPRVRALALSDPPPEREK